MYICCHLYAYVCKYVFRYILFCIELPEMRATGWRRIIGCLIFIVHFPQKSPVISESSAGNDLRLRHPMGLRHPVLVAELPNYTYV